LIRNSGVRYLGIIFILVLTACSTPAANIPFEHQVDAIFDAYSMEDSPGYAIGVIRDEKLVFAKGYGLSNLEDSKPITADMAFNLASLSKQFTAAAIALEVNHGNIDLNDILLQYWPSLPEFMHDITLAHLIYMTSGLKEYHTLAAPKGGWSSEDEFTIDDTITAVLASNQLQYKPGSRWAYSNTNYQLLAVMIGKINNQSFAEYMQAVIFDPLEMSHSWIDTPIDNSRNYKSTSYVWSEDESGWKVAPRLSAHFGGSGVYASLNDLAKWDKALYQSDQLGPGFNKLMLSTRKFEHDKSNDAFGLVHGEYSGLKTIWYEGGDYGVSTYMVRLPQRNEPIICLSNFHPGNCKAKAKLILDLLIANVIPVALPKD